MKRLEKLTDLTRYLTEFRPDDPEIVPLRVVNHSQATSRLVNRSGTQVLIARPETEQDGNSDTYTSSYSTAIFVLEKNLDADRTDQREDEQYGRLLDLTSEILTKIENDTGNFNTSYMRDMTITSLAVVPETSIFGGWCGYSIEIAFK